MNKTDVAKFINSAHGVMKKHSPEILTGIGIAGMITTTVLAVKATPKALELLKDAEIEKFDTQASYGILPEDFKGLTPLEVVKCAWKPYIPAAVTGVASVACLIGASAVSLRRNAALATAYKLSETALAEYREQVVETIGEKKEQLVREKVNQKQIDKNPVNDDEILDTGNGDTLFLDPLSKRYFKSDIEKVRKVENILNKRMLHDICGTASLNEFYDELGLDRTDIGDDMGWNTDCLIDLDITPGITKKEKPCLIIGHHNPPKWGY